jgi:hypothetical protein
MTETKIILPHDLPPLVDLQLSDIVNAASKVAPEDRAVFVKLVGDVLRPIRFPLQADIRRAIKIATERLARRRAQ